MPRYRAYQSASAFGSRARKGVAAYPENFLHGPDPTVGHRQFRLTGSVRGPGGVVTVSPWPGKRTQCETSTRFFDDLYVGQARVTRDEIYRRVVSEDAPVEVVTALDGLPEGGVRPGRGDEALHQIGEPDSGILSGVPATELDNENLLRELAGMHRTRFETLRHGSDQALAHHDQRTAELEDEYLRRFPDREVDPMRTRVGARQRGLRRNWPDDRDIRTGSDQPWDPEDLAVAEGQDPTPENIARARRRLQEQGSAAIERTVPSGQARIVAAHFPFAGGHDSVVIRRVGRPRRRSPRTG